MSSRASAMTPLPPGTRSSKAGAGRGARHLLFITVSTGIGGALFIDGDLYDGATGSAGEVGHTPISDNGPACGQGHPDASRAPRRAPRLPPACAPSSPRAPPRRCRASIPRPSTLRAIVTAANAGDALSLQVFDEAGHALGRAIGGFINVLAPDTIVIGGGLIHAGDLLLKPAAPRRDPDRLRDPLPPQQDRHRSARHRRGADRRGGVGGAQLWWRSGRDALETHGESGNTEDRSASRWVFE